MHNSSSVMSIYILEKYLPTLTDSIGIDLQDSRKESCKLTFTKNLYLLITAFRLWLEQ